jgi:hypothetical protein
VGREQQTRRAIPPEHEIPEMAAIGRHVRFIRRHVESAILRAEEVRRSDQVGAGLGDPGE